MRLETATDELISEEPAAGGSRRSGPDSHGSSAARLPWEPGSHPDPSGLGNAELESGILDLAAALAAWSHRNETADEIDARHHAGRSVTWRTECQWPGCHAKTLLQYDHKLPFLLGGPTTVDNLQRLCGPHNRAEYAAEISTAEVGASEVRRRAG